MGWFQFGYAAFSAVAALPFLIGKVEQMAAGIALWWVERQNTQTQKGILDAAALAIRAKTQEERRASLDAWRVALSKSRLMP